MDKSLEVHYLTSAKSSLVFDYMQHESGQPYLMIEHVVHQEDGTDVRQVIKINPDLMTDFVAICKDFQLRFPRPSGKEKTLSPGIDVVREILRRYYIGVPLKELAVQFNCSVKTIERILLSNDIEIVTTGNGLPPKKKNFRFYRRK